MSAPCRVSVRVVPLVALLGLGLAATAEAQPSGRRSAAEIIATIRAHGRISAAISVLSQHDSAYARPVLDELADSLTAMAVAADPEREGSDVALRVVGVLTDASSRYARVPYEGAAERLMRIHQQARDHAIRIVAFGSLLDLANIGRVLPYVRAFVTSEERDVDLGVSQIIMRAEERSVLFRPEARALLRELYEGNLVPDPEARLVLEAFAAEQGWSRRT